MKLDDFFKLRDEIFKKDYELKIKVLEDPNLRKEISNLFKILSRKTNLAILLYLYEKGYAKIEDLKGLEIKNLEKLTNKLIKAGLITKENFKNGGYLLTNYGRYVLEILPMFFLLPFSEYIPEGFSKEAKEIYREEALKAKVVKWVYERREIQKRKDDIRRRYKEIILISS